MENKIGFLEEVKDGLIHKSSTRLMALLSLLVGLGIAVASVFMDSITLGEALPFTGTLLAYSLGAKAFKDYSPQEIKK